MRIISGKYRGRKLTESLHLKDLRPTTDTNRENLFNILYSSKELKQIGFELTNCNLLDVFCGTAAISLEALSRNAKSATLIDNNRQHLAIAKSNADLLKEENLEYFSFDLTKPALKAKKIYNLVFIDPPYSKNLAAIAFENLDKSGWIAENALVIIEHSRSENLQPLIEKLKLILQKNYKETIFSFFIKI